ncbi:MAG: ATP-binding protein [Chloroflexota bacterium]|nr:ATP-binding protein [Chloroflexota bacterium]
MATNTSSKYDGRGLGLALVRELVEAQGGEISVHSVVGEGTTFSVTCPLLKKG